MAKIPGLIEVCSKTEFYTSVLPVGDEEEFVKYCKSDLYYSLGGVLHDEGYGRFDDEVYLGGNRRRMRVSLIVVSDLKALSDAFHELETRLAHAESIIAELSGSSANFSDSNTKELS